MYPAAFEYRRAATMTEAVQMLQEAPEGRAKLLAGGHSLLPLMKLRLTAPEVLIDIGRVTELKGIHVDDTHLVIGALTTHRELSVSPLVRRRCPLLAEAATQVGDMQVRNRGTVGGNLAHADPASDLPAVALATNAEMVAFGPRGRRHVAARDFFLGPLMTALEPAEVLAEVRIPLPTAPDGVGSAYLKHPHPASGYAVVGVAAMVGLDPGGRCQTIRVGITGAGSSPYRAEAAEQALVGQVPSESAIRAAAARAADGADIMGDLYASPAYRRHLVQVYVEQALAQAVERARKAA